MKNKERYVILKTEGETERLTLILYCYYEQPSYVVIWRLFSFTLENLITETYKGNNEYSKLDQVLICNIHCEPSFLLEGQEPS